MLQKIRKKATGIVGIIILALISLTFVFWGVDGYFNQAPPDVAATVNGVEIQGVEFDNRFNNYRQSQLNRGVPAEMVDSPVARREFLEALITRELWLQAAQNADLTVSPETLRETIRNLPQFQVNGEFNSDVYVELLRQLGYRPEGFQRILTTDLLAQALERTLLETSVATDAEAERLRQLQEQTRTFAYRTFSADDYIGQVELSEEALAEYHAANEAQFRKPETVTIEYVELAAEDLGGDVTVEEGVLEQRYEERRELYRVPEGRRVAHILIEPGDDEEAARALAQELAERARSGEDFGALAREYSADPGSAPEGGDLGLIQQDGTMVEAFEDAVFDMEAGEISDPVETGFGFHVIQLREIEPARGKTFEEMRDDLAAEYIAEQSERRFLDEQDALVDLLNFESQDSLLPAEERGLEIQTAGPFSRAGGDGIAANRAVVEAAFSDEVLYEGMTSDPVSLEGNRVVFLRVIEHDPASVKPLEEVRDEVTEALRRERALKMAQEAAEAALAALRSGDETVLADAQRAQAVGRNTSQHDFALVRQVFQMAQPQDGPTRAVVPVSNTGYALVELSEVAVPPATPGADLARFEGRVSTGFAMAEREAVLEALRQAADIYVNEQRIAGSELP